MLPLLRQQIHRRPAQPLVARQNPGDAFARVPEAGYRVVGVCTSTAETRQVGGVPVVGSEYQAAQLAMELGVDVVACGADHRLGISGLRRLGWALEGSGIELVVSPGLTEVAGPRVLARPVAGLPLLHVEAPEFSGPKLAVKTTLDWLGALALLLVLSPLMVVVAAALALQAAALLWLAGDAESVHARQQVAASDPAVRTAHVVLTHRSGALSHCRGFWGPGGTRFRYTFDLAGDRGRLRYDSAGDAGIAFDDVASARQASGDGFLPDVSTMEDPYAAEIAEFARAVIVGGATRVEAADGARAVEVSRAALDSLRTGRSIPC